MATGEKLQKISEGREAEIFAWGDDAVLRLLRAGSAPERLEREAAAMKAARAAGVAVPEVRELVTLMDRPGMVMERIDGIDLLTTIGKKPWTVWRVGRVAGELQAALNNVRAPESLPKLHPTVERHIRALDVPAAQEHLRAFVLNLLATMPDGDVICHGDFHPGNIIDGSRGPMIIDWPNVTSGDGDADYARTLLTLQIGEPPPGAPVAIRLLAKVARGLLISAFRRAYLSKRQVNETLLSKWETVRAADRLWDGIESERAVLMRLIAQRYGEART